MALGIERALAIYLGSEMGLGLYDDVTPANRVIQTSEMPAVRKSESSDFPALHLCLFQDGGPPQDGLIGEQWTMTVQVRHDSSETALERAREVHTLLHENGGASNGSRPNAQGVFSGIRIARITADFQPVRLGRDQAGSGGRYTVTQSFTVEAVAGFDFTED